MIKKLKLKELRIYHTLTKTAAAKRKENVFINKAPPKPSKAKSVCTALIMRGAMVIKTGGIICQNRFA